MAAHTDVNTSATKSFTEPKARYPEPRLLRAAEQVALDVPLPQLDDTTFNRHWHRGVRTERSFARRVTVPSGGGTPIHAVTCDHIIVGVTGQADFEMNGQTYRVESGDLLYFPANMLYGIRNRGDADAAFISVGLEAEFGWPPRSDYWADPAPAGD